MIEKVLFLDIDGVIKPFREETFRDGTILLVTEKDVDMLPKTKVALLNEIVKRTNCEVVISSTWRTNHTLIWFDKMFQEAGYVGSFLGVTPDRPGKQRGEEVRAWLAAHKTERYAILDDRNDFLPHQMQHLVQTRSDPGLTEEHVEKVVELLAE